MTQVFIFPSPLQYRSIEELAVMQSCAVAAVFSDSSTTPRSIHVQTFHIPDFLEWAEGQQGDEWFCCNELAIYFVAKHRQLAGRLPFREVCLDMLTKLDMHEELCRAGVPSLPKTPLSKLRRPLDYPVVVKPNFGFASTLVKRIKSEDELESYLAEYSSLRRVSVVASCEARYLDYYARTVLEQLLVEPDKSTGTFLSITFVVREGRLDSSWPAIGYRRECTGESHFRWAGFQAPTYLSGASREMLDETLDRLAHTFVTGNWVCSAEVILDEVDGTPWVLEFSPRVMSGSLPRLIYHAHGVDLERQMIAFALGINLPFRTVFNRKCLLVRRTDTGTSESLSRLPDGVLERQIRRIGDERFFDEVRVP